MLVAGWYRRCTPEREGRWHRTPGSRRAACQRCAAELHARRRWPEAEAVAGRAVALLAQEPDGPAVGGTLQALAGTLDDLGDHVAAEALYRRAATILAALPPGGPDDGLRIRCARGLAANLRMQRREQEADGILVAALALAEQLLGPSDVDTVATMTALGLLSEGLGRSDEAEELYRQALTRAEGGGGSDAGEVAGIAAALAGLLERRASAAAGPSSDRTLRS